ncbi:MAG: DUF3108 domain-containing protein [Sphingobacteriales bacterium]|nr:MAG: DUF3108 domain-containing protein [Sphingobacteriales bacterium]
MKKFLIAILLMLVTRSTSAGDDFCGIVNTTFLNGERITFKVFYSVIGLYVDAGTAYVNVGMEKLNNQPTYHIIADGYSNPTYDWIFKVRDRYESYIDTQSLKPYKFVRNIDEGGYKKKENVTFNHNGKSASTEKGQVPIPPCVQDVISAVYYARNIDYNKYKVNDKIPFSLFIDNEVYQLTIRYLGKETVKTKYGKFNAIKIKPLLIKGSIFEGGEKMNIWISDDRNHIPLRVESPITVGSVKVDMMGFNNLRYPLTSKVSTRF